MPQWYVIVNPTAGAGRAGRKWPKYYKKLQEKAAIVQVFHTTHQGHATELCTEAVLAGAKFILVVGGDGTLHEVLNGIFQQSIVPSQHITLAMLPIGTGNDWIKTHGIPKAFNQWLLYFKNGTPQAHSVGRIHYHTAEGLSERYFWNVAGLSYDGFVVQYVEQRKHLIKHAVVYILFIVWCLFSFRLSKGKIRFDQQEQEGKFYTINIGIGKYSGGGMQLTPQAQYNGDQLGLTIAGEVSKLQVIRNIGRFFKGTLGQHPQVEEYQASSIHIETIEGAPILVEADGEFLGETPATFTHLAKAVQFWNKSS